MSPARSSRQPTGGRGNEEPTSDWSGHSAQQRLLENELKLTDGANRAGEDGLQVLNGLEEWIVVRAVRWALSTAEANADGVESTPEASEQVIQRLQGQGQLESVRCRPDRDAG